MAVTIDGTANTITAAATSATTATSATALTTASGSAPSYSARAWVNFNGSGTVAIRSSGNVSSITDVGVGQYTVNFTNAMPDVNFSVCGSCGGTNAGISGLWIINGSNVGARYWNNTTTSTVIQTAYATTALADAEAVSVQIFR